ncbi:hypothetical protein TNCV_985671 [Trichonephila clavipes]|uniref:Uncharacterized protein n=1 Tax=Trichonephila clavipes TaxID=2585209 RepID=A0A8X6SLK3_TRICX|nr:hypothetical protein TNCV_985671 [Trichonephila clavipes]
MAPFSICTKKKKSSDSVFVCGRYETYARYLPYLPLGCVGCTKTTLTGMQDRTGMQGRKCRSYELWCKAEKKNRNSAPLKDTDILLKDCTTTVIQNYYQKSSDKPNNDSARNYRRSGKFLTCHVSSQQLQILEC